MVRCVFVALIGAKVYSLLILKLPEYAHDCSDLGAVLNGFSLNEEGQLAAAIEKTGQAIDATYISTTQLVSTFASFACGSEE